MDEKWQTLIAECEKLSKMAGVPIPDGLALPPAGQPVGLEWADHRIRDARLLDLLIGFLYDINDVLHTRTSQSPRQIKAQGETPEGEKP